MSSELIIRVRDVMNEEFDLVSGMATVAEVLKNSKFPESKCFVVDRRNENDEYGVVLLSDIAKKVLACNKSTERTNIYEIMSKPAISIDPDMNIRYCARLFESFGLGRAPVIENKKVIGVIGYSDMVLRGLRDRITQESEAPADDNT